jgi:hypothetical protein
VFVVVRSARALAVLFVSMPSSCRTVLALDPDSGVLDARLGATEPAEGLSAQAAHHQVAKYRPFRFGTGLRVGLL